MGHTEGGGSIRTSLGVDIVWDFSLLTWPCRGAALLLVVRVFVMQYLFTVGIIALKLSLGVDVVGDVLGLPMEPLLLFWYWIYTFVNSIKPKKKEESCCVVCAEKHF